ncbi:hypothetical protein SLNSH_14640 [Alsobacter soli]|uniref:Uncharacterized protein n=1 Tax=Alsobacter soli TaxID=2109933 RepID=A0A2T1HRD9_9HYPH|nr:hypothetical protein SLNSH_14640 [Alsobacter soli]
MQETKHAPDGGGLGVLAHSKAPGDALRIFAGRHGLVDPASLSEMAGEMLFGPPAVRRQLATAIGLGVLAKALPLFLTREARTALEGEYGAFALSFALSRASDAPTFRDVGLSPAQALATGEACLAKFLHEREPSALAWFDLVCAKGGSALLTPLRHGAQVVELAWRSWRDQQGPASIPAASARA